MLDRTNALLMPKIGRTLRELPNVEFDSIQRAIGERLADLQELIKTLETQLLPHAYSCALGDGLDKSGVIYKTEVPFVIPVALSGSGDFMLTQKRIRAVLGVIPQKGKTNIFMLGAAANSSDLLAYWKQRTDGPKNILGMVSSWMTHGTDQWYCDPAHWDKLSDEIRSRIISDIDSNKLDIAASAVNIFSTLEKAF